MVRINLVNQELLSDQHLIAEYNEILMLVAFVKKYPETENIPKNYCLGKGHMTFFKDKLLYIKNRHDQHKLGMKKRNFQTNKTINLDFFQKKNINNWKPREKDIEIIKFRIISKLKFKPNYYRYYGKYKSANFFIDLLSD